MRLSAIALVATGTVAGFVLGGIAPRRELGDVRAERDALQRQLDQVEGPSLLEALLPRFGAAESPRRSPDARGSFEPRPQDPERPTDARPPPQGDVVVIHGSEQSTGPTTASPSAPATGPAVQDTPQAQAQARREDDDDRDRDEWPRGERFLERFDQLVTAQRARTAAARAALIAQADLDQEQLQQVDATVSRMNGKLHGYGEEVIAQAASEKRPEPAQALGLGHDVSGILYEGQKELDAVIGEAAEGVDESAREIWSYVDLQQWRPFVEKQLGAQGAPGEPPAAPAPAKGGAAGSGAE